MTKETPGDEVVHFQICLTSTLEDTGPVGYYHVWKLNSPLIRIQSWSFTRFWHSPTFRQSQPNPLKMVDLLQSINSFINYTIS